MGFRVSGLGFRVSGVRGSGIALCVGLEGLWTGSCGRGLQSGEGRPSLDSKQLHMMGDVA